MRNSLFSAAARRHRAALALAAAGATLAVSAAPLDITDTPLFLTTQRVYPNLVLTMDDSLSMPSGAGRDSINAEYNTKRYKAASYNALYYNPAIAYTPPPRYNGTGCTLDSNNPDSCHPNVDFAAAPINGFDTTRGAGTNASSECNPLGTAGKKYSPAALTDNYAVVHSFSPDDDVQSCGNADGSTTGGTSTYNGATTAYSATCQVDFDNNYSGSNDRLHVDTTSAACHTDLFNVLAVGSRLTTSHATFPGPYTVSGLDAAGYYINFGAAWTSADSNNQPNVVLTPDNHCRVDFINNGSSDYIAIDSTHAACRTNFFNNLGAGATLTVSGSSRAGSYAVSSADASNWRIYVGSQWSSDLTDQPVSMSWTRTVTSGTATYPAYYYLFYTAAGIATPPSGCSGPTSTTTDACYVKIVAGSADDIAGKNHPAISGNQQALQKAASSTWPWTASQQKQNFANWYSYYRTRNLAAVSSVMRGFASIDERVRVGWQAIGDSSPTCNTFGTACRGWDYSTNASSTVDNRVRRLSSQIAAAPSSNRTHKQELYDWLARFPVAGSTYIRKSALRVGALIGGTVDINHPYADDPGFRQYPVKADGTPRTTYDGCRRNIHLIVTDGGWCGDSADSAVAAVTDVDSSTLALPESWPGDASPPYNWTPSYPFKDKQSKTLADIAMQQWYVDALSGTGSTAVANTVAPLWRDNVGSDQAKWLNPKNDPATWQHINTYTIAFGLKEALNGTPVSGTGALPIWQGSTFASDPVTGDGYYKLSLGTSCPSSTTSSTATSAYCWPGVSESANCPPTALDQQRKVYDLWHAAINGRGEFFSAESPQDLTDAVASVLGQAGAATASFSALAANSTSLQSNTLLYQSKFDSRDWSGQLLAYPLQAGGTITGAVWDSALRIPAPNARSIWTLIDGAPATFGCSGSLQAALDADGQCAARIAWMKGDHGDEERNGGSFRNRQHTVPDDTDVDGDGLRWDPDKDTITTDWVLGDIVSSSPAYVQARDYGYGVLSGLEGSSYAAYVAANTTRHEVVYVGANDGMLHAFRADGNATSGGVELFAYVPAAVHGNLYKLMLPGYTHVSYVDAGPVAGDAYLGGAWKTVLVGGLGKGGKSVYALDITNPTTFPTTNPVMWEFTHAGMGYSFSQPQIGRLKNGKWVAVFGNGYNSTSERAHLYIVNLADATDYKQITVPELSGCSSGCSNGLSTPVLFDKDNDGSVDYAYAGDLQGNLWRFDLNATGASVAGAAGLDVAFDGVPLFTARNAGSAVQPITAKPVVAMAGTRRMVMFGTGEYLTLGDTTSTTQQTIYHIADTGSEIETLDRSELTRQTIATQTTVGSLDIRVISANAGAAGARGCYLDLPAPAGAAAERVVDYGQIIRDRIAYVTNIPSNEACTPGGTSWLMELDIASCGRTADDILDINGDLVFDVGDRYQDHTVTGVKLAIGLAKPPVTVENPGDEETLKIMSGTEGLGGTTAGRAERNYNPQAAAPAGRTFWLQIQ